MGTSNPFVRHSLLLSDFTLGEKENLQLSIIVHFCFGSISLSPFEFLVLKSCFGFPLYWPFLWDSTVRQIIVTGHTVQMCLEI